MSTQQPLLRPAAALASELVEAADALGAAANRGAQYTHDRDQRGLDHFERLAEFAGGIQRLAMATRSAMVRERVEGGKDAL